MDRWAPAALESELGKRNVTAIGVLAVVLFVATAAASTAQSRSDAEAVKLNNRGVAQMSQQFTERAVASFAESFQKDPKLAQAEVNEGIALMALQKLDEAKKALQAALRWSQTTLKPGTTWALRNTRATNSNRRSPAFNRRSRTIREMRIPTTLRAFATRN